jgi:hypothetical protein
VQSVIVVKDSPQETVLLLLPGAQCAYPSSYVHWRNHDASGPSRWQEALSDSHAMTEFPWETNRLLIFLEPEKYYSPFLFWNQATDEFLFYYINFQLPFRRSHCGFDTLDLDLDMVIQPDYSWKWKDVDEYEEGIRAGGIKEEWMKAIEAARPEALERIYHHSYPFDGSWNSWTPETGWRPPSLPLDWHTL